MSSQWPALIGLAGVFVTQCGAIAVGLLNRRAINSSDPVVAIETINDIKRSVDGLETIMMNHLLDHTYRGGHR
jgi:hypothetical protein